MAPSRSRTRGARAALIALPVYWLLLAVATHYPSVPNPGEVPQGDKVVHFVAFGLLAFLCWQFAAARRPLGARFVWRSGGLLIAYATVDEWTQQFVGRHTDPADLAANVAGILSVLAVLELRRRRAARTGPRPPAA